MAKGKSVIQFKSSVYAEQMSERLIQINLNGALTTFYGLGKKRRHIHLITQARI